jgi:hypothetical protein
MACKPSVTGCWRRSSSTRTAPLRPRRVVTALRERYWEGDDVLADQLEALLRSGAMPDLCPLRVDLDELAGILEGDPVYGGGRVDLTTGEVWPTPAVDYAREIGQEDEDESDDPDKWLWVHCEGSRDGYRDMELFIGTVRDPGRADRLEIAGRRPKLWGSKTGHRLLTCGFACGSGPGRAASRGCDSTDALPDVRPHGR